KTRDTLEALPEILQRAILKHRSHQKKRSLEVKKHLEGHRRKFKKVLGKVENIGRQLQDLQKTTTNPETKPEAETTSTMEHFNKQITMLKEFVGKLLKRNE
ncbi:MAG TPA: hypothetical protein DF383_11710, partial [Deltaproteobacteria bacterium]|nr:hypothetical protein [Deltaproteobacteria bacterium]